MRLDIDKDGSWVLIHQLDGEECASVWSLYGIENFGRLLPRLWRDLTVHMSNLDSHLKDHLEAGWAIRVIQLSQQVNALGGNPKDSQDWKLLEGTTADYYQRHLDMREAYNDKAATKEVGLRRGEFKVAATGHFNRQQSTLMAFDPATGVEQPYPSHAAQWRHYHGHSTAWLFNPWTGKRRVAEDVGSDLVGHLIVPPGEPVCAAVDKDEATEDTAATLESIHKLLDTIGVPRAVGGTVYSLWGRVLLFKHGPYSVLSAEVLG